MSVRRFLFNPGVISSVLGGVGVARQTASGPRNWRLILMWVAWAIGVAIAIGTVIEDTREQNELEY